MKLICGLCADRHLGDLRPADFSRALREHRATHAHQDPVLRMLSPTSFVLVKRGEPDGYLQIGKVRLHYEFG